MLSFDVYADEKSGLPKVITTLSRLSRYQTLVKEIPRMDSSKITPEYLTVWVLLDHALHVGCDWVSERNVHQYALHRFKHCLNYKAYELNAARC